MGHSTDAGTRRMHALSRGERRLWFGIRRVDWRGWIALAWALFWGVSYCGMVVQARGDRIRAWFSPRAGASLTIESSSKTLPSSVQAR
jgi:hypothetical protein